MLFRSSDTDPILANQLPFVLVSEGRAIFAPLYAGTDNVTQEYVLLFYIASWETASAASEQAAREAARLWQQRVHRFFMGKPRLENGDNGPNSINRARLVGHDGPQSASRNQRFYYGIAFRLNVEYEESLD